MAKSKTAVTFNIKPLVVACSAAEKAWVKADLARNVALDRLADKFRGFGVTPEMLAGNAQTSAPRKVIKNFFDHLAAVIYKDKDGVEHLNPSAKDIADKKLALVRDAMLSKATAATYQSCFWIAFEKGVPFSPSLANQATKAKAKETVGTGKKADDSAKAKGSIVVKASRDNLQSLLLQTIKMARELGLKDFALELVESGRGIDLLPKDFK